MPTRTRPSPDFRKREGARVYSLREKLFSPAACQSLCRNKHLLGGSFKEENIYEGFRQDALDFFEARELKWHGKGGTCDSSIVSSQVACLNCFFPFVTEAKALECWLSTLYPDFQSVLPIDNPTEPHLPSGQIPNLTFEWIGTKKYLSERSYGRRGQNCTSVDVLFRFLTTDKRVHLVLTEWKYCEKYDHKSKYIRFSDRGTDRVAIYKPDYQRAGSQLQLQDNCFEDLFFEPFDQLMRLQLLASAMERERELDADIVSVLHISPRANDGLMNKALAAKVASGDTLGAVWGKIVRPDRFKAIALEDLVPVITASSNDRRWSDYTMIRYGSI
jgi:hypothetical protein